MRRRCRRSARGRATSDHASPVIPGRAKREPGMTINRGRSQCLSTVMAPLTRNRAVAGMVPNSLAIEYYGQRASAGLLITEASQVSQQGQGYQDTPGIYSKEQIAGWRKVTNRVHERGGRIFIQLWHVGRISHVDLQDNK